MVTNTPSLTINSCPRCGSIKEIDARYCPTCGLAFIPFKEYITEQSKNFFNAKLPLRIFGILTFIILSFITADRILFHGFHPATNIIVLSGAALFSFLTGWRLFSNVPNSKKLRFLMVIAVITLVFFKLSSELDEIYLRNTITAENPLSYQFLDSETYVAYVEEEKQVFYSDQHLTPNRSWIQMYHYFPPYDNIPPTGFSIGFESSQPYTITLNHPALVIERSWAFKDYYFLFSTLLIAAFTSAGFFTAKKIAKRNFVKKS